MATHRLEGLLVLLVLLPDCLAKGMQRVFGLTSHVRRAQGVDHNIVGEVVDVLVPGLVDKKHVATPLVGTEPRLDSNSAVARLKKKKKNPSKID